MNQETAERWQGTYLEPNIDHLGEQEVIDAIPIMKSDWSKKANPKPDELVQFILKLRRKELMGQAQVSCPHCFFGWAPFRAWAWGPGGRTACFFEVPNSFTDEEKEQLFPYMNKQMFCQCPAGDAARMLEKQRSPDLDMEMSKRISKACCKWQLTLKGTERIRYYPGAVDENNRAAEAAERKERDARRK